MVASKAARTAPGSSVAHHRKGHRQWRSRPMTGRDTSRRFKKSRKDDLSAAATRGRRSRSGAFRGRSRRAGESGSLRKPLGTIRPICERRRAIWFAFAGAPHTYGRAAIRCVASIRRAGSRIVIATPSPIRRMGGTYARTVGARLAPGPKPWAARTYTTPIKSGGGIQLRFLRNEQDRIYLVPRSRRGRASALNATATDSGGTSRIRAQQPPSNRACKAGTVPPLGAAVR